MFLRSQFNGVYNNPPLYLVTIQNPVWPAGARSSRLELSDVLHRALEPPVPHVPVCHEPRATTWYSLFFSALRRQNLPCPDANLYSLLDTLVSFDITFTLEGKNCTIPNFTGYPNLISFDMRQNKLKGAHPDSA